MKTLEVWLHLIRLLTVILRSISLFKLIIYQQQKQFPLQSCHVQHFGVSSDRWSRVVHVHIGVLGGRPLTPAVHLMEDEQEQSRDDESHPCHDEPRSIITHLVYEESYREKCV